MKLLMIMLNEIFVTFVKLTVEFYFFSSAQFAGNVPAGRGTGQLPGYNDYGQPPPPAQGSSFVSTDVHNVHKI